MVRLLVVEPVAALRGAGALQIPDTAAQYEADLETNLTGLLERFKSGRYRAPAVRRVTERRYDAMVLRASARTVMSLIIR